jgi:hypothetical protein
MMTETGIRDYGEFRMSPEWRPLKGEHPNWFWRWMQFLAFGNRWKRNPK